MVHSIDTLPPLRNIIEVHDLNPDKKLGQNFLLDLNITDKIVRNIGSLSDATVIEIGPGPGGLTRSLLKTDLKQIHAIEYDTRAVKALGSLIKVSEGRLNVIEADALQTALPDICPDASYYIVGNLPYNIGTPLLMNWLADIANGAPVKAMALMFQKEVADRITASPSTKKYGRLSVMSQWLCHGSSLMDLPPDVFVPPPKIHSSVVYLEPKTQDNTRAAPKFETMERIVKMAFQQRRKMLRSTLKPFQHLLAEAGINPQDRAEDIGVDQYVKLALAVEQE